MAVKKITIVMPYHDRQRQLNNTLQSLKKSKYKNFDVVIVDHNSIESIILPDLPYGVTILEVKNRQWTNCSPVYNLGFDYAIKNGAEIIIIQSAECYHKGDIISYSAGVTEDKYIVFGCFQADKHTSLTGIDEIIKNNNLHVTNDGGAGQPGQNAWWNHSEYFPNPFHWCASITTNNLIKLNGFDERFALGYASEDGYFVDQARRLGLKIEIIDNPFVIHQWHGHDFISNKGNLVQINLAVWGKLLMENTYKAKHLFTPNFGLWHLKVPKILHIYWGIGVLPYLRFNTVSTFMKLNPDWKVILWTPKYPSKVLTWNTGQLDYQTKWIDYTKELLELPIDKRQIDLKDYGLSNNISEVHKSDFIRYYLLSKYGGVWSDMDILYFNPITDLKVNCVENQDKETFVCISHYGHSNGFFMASKGSKFFQRMFKLAFDADLSKYQGNGPDLCNKFYPTLGSINEFSPAADIGMDAVYFYNAQMVLRIYKDCDPKFPEHSIGIHWYAGHSLSGKFLNETNGGISNLPNNIIGNLCKNLQL